jgi:hypothetical protein
LFDVQPPFDNGAFTPVGGTVGSVTYKYLLGTDKYELSTLTLASRDKMAVSGHAVLLVNGDVNIQGEVHILPGGTLELYVAGSNASIGGQGVFNGTGQQQTLCITVCPRTSN